MPSAARASSRAPSTSAPAQAGIEAAENVGPRAVAAQRGAWAARAIGKAAHRAHGHFRSRGGAFDRRGEHGAGTQFAVRLTDGPAGDAHIDGRRVGRGRAICHARLIARTHPRRSDMRHGVQRVNDRYRGTPPGQRPHRRQVSWLAARRPLPPSRVNPVASDWHGLAAYSCGGSCGLGTRRFRTAFPIGSHVRGRRIAATKRPSRGLCQCRHGRLAAGPPGAIIAGAVGSRIGGTQ